MKEKKFTNINKKQKYENILTNFNVNKLSIEEMNIYSKLSDNLNLELKRNIINRVSLENDSLAEYNVSVPILRPMHIKKSKTTAKTSGYSIRCGIKESSAWRRGPKGLKSLCNACGLNYAKKLKDESKISHTNTTEKVKISNLLN